MEQQSYQSTFCLGDLPLSRVLPNELGFDLSHLDIASCKLLYTAFYDLDAVDLYQPTGLVPHCPRR